MRLVSMLPEYEPVGSPDRESKQRETNMRMANIRSTGMLLRASATGLIVLSLIAAPAAAQARGDQYAVADRSSRAISIDNFGRVDANYYRGAQPSARQYEDLAALGIRTVIDLTSDDSQANENSMVEAAGMKYVRIPMTTHAAPTAAQVQQFLSIVNDPSRQPVYVHCVGGRHRTGVMTAVYRMANDRWPADRAFAEMKQFKFGPDFLHPEFKSYVYGYRAASADAANSHAANATKSGS